MPFSTDRLIIVAGLSGLLIAGCASNPTINTNLVDARDAYMNASQSPEVIQHAPIALKQAEESLQQAEQLWKKGAEQAVVSHHAYLTFQRIGIAQEKAAANAAEKAVQAAESERRDVLLYSRDSEAKREREKALSLAKQLEQLQAKQTDRGAVLTLGDVLFDINKSSLKPGGINVIDRLAVFLFDNPSRNLLIEGFTDSTGTVEHNQALAEQRAQVVNRELINRGIDVSRISTVGYGERFPVASNATPAGRQMNRRVEIVISDESTQISERRK